MELDLEKCVDSSGQRVGPVEFHTEESLDQSKEDEILQYSEDATVCLLGPK